jgi:hypothetical protein
VKQIDQVSKLDHCQQFCNVICSNCIIPILEESIGSPFFQVQSQTNNQYAAICSDLESKAKLHYDYWFEQFEFPEKMVSLTNQRWEKGLE